MSSPGQHDRIVFTEFNGLAGQSRGFADFLLTFRNPAGCLSLDIAHCTVGVGSCEGWVGLGCLRKQSHGLADLFIDVLIEILHPPQIIIVSIEAFGWLTLG